LVATALGGLFVGSASAVPAGKYVLALGDSLASGYQPTDKTSLPPIDSSTGFRDTGYSNSYAADVASTLGRTLIDLGCPGETSTSMLATPALVQCGALYKAAFDVTSQIAAAKAFLAGHLNQVSIVTLDIGANDLDRCFSATSVNTSCLKSTNATVIANLSTILTSLNASLRKDDPSARLVGMNYYDPFLGLAYKPGGSHGAELAAVSVAATDAFNLELSGMFRKFGVARADVASAFHTDSALPLAEYAGKRLPTDVTDVCSWTWMCPQSATASQDVHPTTAGYRVIADAFDRVISP
jgi:lysophospholipase L1-like esterase